MNTKTILALAFAGLFAAISSADPLGVTVNNIMLDDNGPFSGTGWAYDPDTCILTLDGADPVTLSGKDTEGRVRIVVATNVTAEVTLSNLTINMPWWVGSASAFALETNACVSLVLAGENVLQSSDNRAALEVPAGASLSMTNAPDDTAGALFVYGGYQAAAIGGSYGGVCGAVILNGGTVTAEGGYKSAGIGGAYNGSAGTVTINGGEVIATGGSGGAGIGGGENRDGGTVTISGGTVFAQGGDYGAGIGGGGSYNTWNGGNGGTVTISGGQVTAYGGTYAAGIGGGGSYSYTGGAGGTVTISGGTVFAEGAFGGADIGPGRSGADGSNRFTGGSICLAGAAVSPAPENNTEPVFCAVVTGFEPYAPVEITTGLTGYGVNDLFADANGCIYLWLPNNAADYTFTANERLCTVRVKNGVGPTGVTVNGEEVAFGPAEPATAGWAFDAATHALALTGAGPFTLAGANVVGGVCVTVSDSVVNTITLSNLTLRTTGSSQCAFALEAGADLALILMGTNALASGSDRAGIEVAAGQTLTITNAPGDDAAALTATGGNCGAGIGGGKNSAGGTIAIAGGAITARSNTTGEFGGAGVGGGAYSTGGDVTITGGSLTATGGNNATGVGGGAKGAGGSLTVSGGSVVATGEGYGAGVGGGENQTGGDVTVSGGTLTAMGGDNGAGIGGGYYGAATNGVVVISGGIVIATGGSSGGAGIGGGYGGGGGTVRIVDGEVTATGGSYASGIGGGDIAAGGVVEIEGGRVVAIGGTGIGGGGSWGDDGGGGGTMTISGGTVFAQGFHGGMDIGPAQNGTGGPANTFTGGSILLAGSSIAPAPSNNTAAVACAVVTGFEPHAPVTITAGLMGYGKNDLFADADGCIYLWLPDGEHTFTANGSDYTVTIQNNVGPTGVTVNGVDVATGVTNNIQHAGWSFDGPTHTLTLSDKSPLTLSGVNVIGGVCVVIPEGVTNAVTLSNLTLQTKGDDQCVFALGIDANVSLFLAGANALASGAERAGLEVAEGQTLSITNAPGDATASLTVTGGDSAAGIGGCSGFGSGVGSDAGTVTISGGIITAIGGEYFAAGIGGGNGGIGGTLTISGGSVVAQGGDFGAGIGTGGYSIWASDKNTSVVTISGGAVTAIGGEMGAGIGGGDSDPGGTVMISGGTVTAMGGEKAAGIGGGAGDEGGTVTISGGRVTATGGDYAAGIGGGAGWDLGGDGSTLTVSGGTVFATGGAGGGPGIGGGNIGGDEMGEGGGTKPNVSGTSLFTGGSIRIDGGYSAAEPSNGMERVWCVTVPGLTPGAAVEIALPAEALPATFGVNDLFADDGGKLYFWLPDGSYAFTANSTNYTATVDGADTTATSGSSGGPAKPVFATDGTALVFSGTTLAIKIVNAQSGFRYTLYAAETLGGDWTLEQSVLAAEDGDLTFTISDATALRRFFKVAASVDEP